MYPNTRLVEIQTDKAARTRVSILKSVPKRKVFNQSLENACAGDVPNNPMINVDTMKAAHKLVKVVDVTTNTIRPLRRPCHLWVRDEQKSVERT